MFSETEKHLARLKNELRAQKVSSGLTYSQMLLPENALEETYSDTLSLSGSGVVARIRFRFTRTDGLTDPPMVNFAYTPTLSPTYRAFAESYGFVFNANDLTYLDRSLVASYIAEVGDGYVDFYIEVTYGTRTSFFSLNSIGFSVTCQAIANVKGILTAERLV